ncbi:hypothetical protein DFH29DRAFT_827672 [Suillus ampliporus]|nr:hypothetical protein DFH29DRAFT_827672 [Suillus ampliporus]
MDAIRNIHHQLIEKKDRITQSLNLHKGLVSGLWRLPTEVLSQIFDHCLPVAEDSPLLSPSRLEAPMLLNEICRRWREVAVGMPSLWCRLRVEVDHSDWERAAFCYNSWLERSRGCPISLALECDTWDSRMLRNLLQPYTNQISSFSIHFPQEAYQPELLLEDLPALQELTIRAINIHTPSIAQSISRLPSTLRSLNVMLSSSFNVEHLSSFNPVWAYLTNVEITIHHPNVLLHLLQLCPNLFSLKVRAALYQIPTLEPFTHTKLQYLCILGSRLGNRSSNMLNALSLPNLCVLETCSIREWPHEEFKAFVVRSNCPLESLHIFGSRATITDEQRAEYIVLIPSLKVVLDPNRTYFA